MKPDREFWIWMALLSALIVLATLWLMPTASAAVQHDAESRHAQRENIPLMIYFQTDSATTQDGYFTGAVTAIADTPDNNAVVTYSLDGAPAVEGKQVRLTAPGQHSITWQVCKGQRCEDPDFQELGIADMSALPLRYNAHRGRWLFTGRVLEIHAVNPLGFAGRAAKVQSRYFSAWVLLDVDGTQVARIEPAIGDLVSVSISGKHVSQIGVDWSECDVESMRRLGDLLDAGGNVSPSNQLIGYNSVSPHRNDALLWTLDAVPEPENLIGEPTDGEYNGNNEGWYRSPLVVARMMVNGKARLYSRLDDGDDFENMPDETSNIATQAVTGDGQHQITWSLDTGESVIQRIFLDATAPDITFDANNPTSLAADTTLSGLASDATSGVREVQFSIDGGRTWEIHPTVDEFPAGKFIWSYIFHASSLPNGSYTIQVRALDMAGNMSTAITREMTVAK